jgi:hypothetical protein
MTCFYCHGEEKLRTLKQLSVEIGIPHWKLKEGAQNGVFPAYRLYNSAWLAYRSEVLGFLNLGEEGFTVRGFLS